MANLKDIKRRIKSVGNTKKITYAMKLVSAAKLKKAQDAVQSARQYTEALNQLVSKVLESVDSSKLSHPLMEPRDDVKAIRILVLGGGRGLCGAFNSNLNKRLNSALKELKIQYPAAKVDTFIVGKKPKEHVEREGITAVKIMQDLPEDGLLWPIEDIAQAVEDAFLKGEVDSVYVLYTRFKSAMSQTPTLEPLLPLSKESLLNVASSIKKEETENSEEQIILPVLFEPSPVEVFKALVPRVMRTKIQQGALDTKASEHGSRMVAMDAATKNAGDLSKKLTLKHNKMRQSAITAELLDIIGGAEAVN
jgi:F-type H+-transporting ATPase subunit gamma